MFVGVKRNGKEEEENTLISLTFVWFGDRFFFLLARVLVWGQIGERWVVVGLKVG